MFGLIPKLQRRSWTLFGILLLVPFVSHAPEYFMGLSINPLWYFSCLSTGVHPGPWFGSRYLDPNSGYVSEALGTLAARDWLHGIIPWWNPYAGIGMPLAGAMQPASFFLPFILLLLLPNGMLWLMISMQMVAGFSTYALLRELSLTRLASVTGAVLFELNGNIAWPGTIAYLCVPSFLPLLVWGIELARRPHGGPTSRLIIAVAIAYMVLAGFPETAYICGLFALLWSFVRCDSLVFATRVIAGGFLGLLLASPLLIAFADLLHRSSAPALHNFSNASQPIEAFGITFLPYITGGPNIQFGSKLLAGIWGGIGSYSGLITTLLAIAGFSSHGEKKLKCLLLAWILIALAVAFGLPFITQLFQHIPFMTNVAFYRYAPASWNFALIVLAAFAMDAFLTRPPRLPVPFICVMALLTVCGYVTRPTDPSWAWPSSNQPIVTLFWMLNLDFAAASLLLSGLLWQKLRGESRRRVLVLSLVAEAAIYFAIPQLNAVQRGRLDTESLQYLHSNIGLSRIYTIGTLAPNYSSYFDVAAIGYNLIPVPDTIAHYVADDLFPGLTPQDSYIIFWPSITSFNRTSTSSGPGDTKTALQKNLSAYLNLGVRYVLVPPGETVPVGAKVFSGSAMDIWELPNPAPYFQITQGGSCRFFNRQRQSVIVDCTAPATLLRRELFMPGWTASINGAKAAIYDATGTPQRVNIPLFQQINVPAGQSLIEFHFAPPYTSYGWLAALFSFLVLAWQTVFICRRRCRHYSSVVNDQRRRPTELK